MGSLRSMARLGLRFLVAAVSWVIVGALRTGVAPTYIQSTRQKTSYETSNLIWNADAWQQTKQLEAEQSAIRSGIRSVESRLIGETNSINKLDLLIASRLGELQTAHQCKQAHLDMEVKEVQRSSGLELENVLFALEKTNLDMSISLTNQSNLALTAHLQKTMAHNIQLEADKKNLILELQNNLRDEKWYHENAIAVEAQRPFEITAEKNFRRQTAYLDQYITDMKQRNELIANRVPGLTAQRDENEDLMLDSIIQKVEHQLVTDNLEHHVHSLQSIVRALEYLNTIYEQQNTDLTTYNEKLTTETDALTLLRNGYRARHEANVNERNAAEIQADHYQVQLRDMRKLGHDAINARDKSLQELDIFTRENQLCDQERDVVTATRDQYATSNQVKRDKCN